MSRRLLPPRPLSYFRRNSMNPLLRFCTGTSLSVLLSAIAPPAFAQATAADLETVVVTATRSAMPLDQVPASISVVTADQIQNTPAQGLNDILRDMPGMVLNDIGPG